MGQLFYDAEIHSVPRKNKSKRAMFIDELKSLVAPDFRPSSVVKTLLRDRSVGYVMLSICHIIMSLCHVMSCHYHRPNFLSFTQSSVVVIHSRVKHSLMSSSSPFLLSHSPSLFWIDSVTSHSSTKKASHASANCCNRIKSPPRLPSPSRRLPSRAAPGGSRIPPPPPINSTNYPNSITKIDGSNVVMPWAPSLPPLPPQPSPSFSSSISWYAGGVDPQNPKSLILFQALQRIQRYLDRPDVSSACDHLRERFVNECGPGGTDKPMQLKRHRSFSDFSLLKARETSLFRRRSMVASHALSPMVHRLNSYQEVSS